MRAFLLHDSEIRLVEAFRKMQPRYAEICWTTIALVLGRNAESLRLRPADGLELAANNAKPARRKARARAALHLVK